MLVTSNTNSIINSMSYYVDGYLVDAGDVWDGFYNVSKVLLTHAHFDHIYGLNEVMARNPEAKVYTNEHGRLMLLDAKKNMSYYHETPFVFEYPNRIEIVNDGDEIDMGEDTIAKAVFTPGHNPSCITWIVGERVFSGDSYIPGLKTVTNLPGGDRRQASESENLIKQLAESRVIYPGHKV